MRRNRSRGLTGDQRLALAVIRQAIEDAGNPSIAPTTRLEATEFLCGSRCEIWYRVARLYAATREQSDQRLSGVN
jgi:hypothetical protein